ncbi:hypothetical protein [Dyadobacter luticola]|uniref:Uncharacterized protein n=1 Tax=Dyadobacter luticola TaxID=1979387 RepID=A0A5R9L3K2_9BACT|nr:hypothetical protein [Dyadobacter luticola]TLV03146.1 hypothetical protein FEN17_05905 [Dyadobacter luticola]
MKLISTIIIVCVGLHAAYAQDKPNLYRIKSGSNINHIIPYREQFQFDQFLDGQAYLRGGRISKGKFNYNLVQSQVMFIGPQRDTLLLTEPDLVDRIVIGNSVYYYQRGHGHIEITGDYGNVQLGRKQNFASMGNEKPAAYGQYSETSAISSFSSFTNQDGRQQYLEGQVRVLLKRVSSYFLVDKNRRVAPANRNNILKYFPSKKRAIADFMKDNSINLDKEPDLIRTLEFCAAL